MGEAFANGVFVLASQESEWCAALKTRDCKKLLGFLRQQPDLWREIDSKGRTVLHVAVIQACSELVVEVLKSVNEPLNTKMLVEARDESLCNAAAYHLARIVGNKDIIVRINKARTDEPPGPQAPMITNQRGHEVCVIIKRTMRNAGIGSRLRQQFEVDVDYNFVKESKQLMCVLHVACKKADQWDFIYEVIRRTKARSNAHVQELFKLKDPQGRTLLHVAIEEDGFHHEELDESMATVVDTALKILEPDLDDECVKNCVNAQDSTGRTPLHRAVANKRAGHKMINVLLNHRMTDVNALWKSVDETVTGNVTALHLAILHNNLDVVKLLLAKDEIRRDMQCNVVITGSGIPKPDSTECKLSERRWTTLELATMMGQLHVVGELLKTKGTPLDVGRCIHLAAARGDPQCLQLLMQHALRIGKGDYFRKIFDGSAPLHFAVHASHPNSEQGDKINHFLTFYNYVNVYGLEQTGVEKCEIGNMENKNDLTSRKYGGKKACANLLLQAGANIWQRDEDQHLIADPGMNAPDEDRHWWYEKVAKKTSDAKKKINAGGTSTAVVAALIASASFSSHLSPPISYDQLSPPIASDHVLITKGDRWSLLHYWGFFLFSAAVEFVHFHKKINASLSGTPQYFSIGEILDVA
ncbi:hypothetical protein CY35_03G115200 [Sphagnum magellanicum]|nr:hypothetical protein CY35_03G115200 [Sphagnum magellanicum]